MNSNFDSRFRIVLLAALIVLITGCAASVRYAPRVPGFVPGYVDQRLGESTYQVRVGEAWPKDWQDLEKFAMYRAAELTQQQGKRYFSVTSSSSQIRDYVIQLPSTSRTTGTVSGYGDNAHVDLTTTSTGGGTSTISGGWYTLEFRVLEASEVEAHSNVVDSEQIINDLKYFIDRRRG
jgi:hypothetical protein